MEDKEIIRATAKWIGNNRNCSWEDGILHAIKLKEEQVQDGR